MNTVFSVIFTRSKSIFLGLRKAENARDKHILERYIHNIPSHIQRPCKLAKVAANAVKT